MKQFLINLGLTLLAVFAPIKGVLITTIVFVMADLVFGLWAARCRKEPITSSGLKTTVTKLLVYQICVMLFFLAESYMVDGVPLVKIVSTYVALVELKSILESLKDITGQDLLLMLVSKITEKLK